VEVHDYDGRLKQILRADDWFTSVLETVRECALPDWLVGGGVIRSIVWDHLHGYVRPMPITDVDVVFFDPHNLGRQPEQAIEERLRRSRTEIPWDVKNQAAVHLWYEPAFGVAVSPLASVVEAVATWPETATCVAVRLQADGDLLVVAPCGLEDLFQCVWRRNPRRVTLEEFRRRAREKQIVQKWPRVHVIEE
jgi:hypothetical protein